MLIVMQEVLVRLISYSLTFKCCGSTTVVLLVLSSFILQTGTMALNILQQREKNKKQTERQKLLKINSKF